MTPANSSSHQKKGFVLPTDSQSDNDAETDHSSLTTSVDDCHQTDGGDDYALLPRADPKGDTIRHAVDDSGEPVCGTGGGFRLVPLSHALEEADRYCEICHGINNGGSERRPCPKCGKGVPRTQWPQHVRKCDVNAESTRRDL